MENISLSEKEKRLLQKVSNDFGTLYSDMPGLIHMTSHSLNTGEKPPIKAKYFRYDRVKMEIIEKNVAQLKGGIVGKKLIHRIARR